MMETLAAGFCRFLSENGLVSQSKYELGCVRMLSRTHLTEPAKKLVIGESFMAQAFPAPQLPVYKSLAYVPLQGMPPQQMIGLLQVTASWRGFRKASKHAGTCPCSGDAWSCNFWFPGNTIFIGLSCYKEGGTGAWWRSKWSGQRTEVMWFLATPVLQEIKV